MRADPFGEAQRIPDVAAQQFFTDREDAITTFRSALAVPAGQSMRALAFYGVGGVGKTSLLHRLREALPDKFPRALIDLQSISEHEAAGVDGVLAGIDAAPAGMTALPPKTDSPTDATRPLEE